MTELPQMKEKSTARPVARKQRTWHEADAPYTFANDDTEWERLNGVHRAIKEYLGNRVTLAPLEDLTPSPKNILELGAGTGVWAMDVANMFPNATVTAVDISFNNIRNPPRNVVLKQLNLLEGFPWEPETFDIVHMRFLLVHMPNFPELAKKCAQVLRPGGILLLEDLDLNLYAMDGEITDNIRTFYDHYHGHMAKSGVDGETGAKLEGVLHQLRMFSDIHVHNMPAPISGPFTDDPKLNKMGAEMRKSLGKAFDGIWVKMPGSGITQEMHDAMVHDAHDPSRQMYMDFYWTWSRKAEKEPETNTLRDQAWAWWEYVVQTGWWILGY
ncbi:S-adenosyl-L-methionine-dependent methyltransferase [Dacryopinax primogenitus]|uniref:S-adenosyl-L-methionine-dependent methyltransferase n=1 Tax=Dacryopinax primogenitus (strain DJM 731) TaxID=1858805 RepID=M5GCR4_DACPD|nr:S-adenosyl-L-methionine-dependent methyltransferase [Dacryopinax primogenitus]EJU01928.1 S-adenosyl-L-methionine-dependent methyltransferase [Dacryopinax primogenitus]